MSTFDDVFGAAESLALPERVRLVQALWQTIPQDDWPAPSDEWITESQRRSEALDAGQIGVSSWEDVRARARREAGLDG
jgi:putative addiction module component (TIGR02574 family)